MMKHAVLTSLVLIALGLGACGIKGPLEPPSAVPASHNEAP